MNEQTGRMKTCSVCKTRKDLCEFHRNKSNSDGHHYHCKQCVHEAYERDKLRVKEYCKTPAPPSTEPENTRGANQYPKQVTVSWDVYASLVRVMQSARILVRHCDKESLCALQASVAHYEKL